MSTETVNIQFIGAEGDGVARTADGPVYVPFTLPGEDVAIARVKSESSVMSWASTSPDRVAPKCRHFGPEGDGGACGGCSLQHWADLPYQDYKRNLVIEALRSRGIETDVKPLVPCSPGERRRVTMTARLTDKGILLGYMQAGSHHVVNVEECPIAHPAIVAKLASIRRLASALGSGSEPFRIVIQVTTSGLDLNFTDLKKPDPKKRPAAVDLCLKDKAIARISLASEILVEPVKPMVEFGGVQVVLPPGGFLQATIRAEDAMAEVISAHIG
ncbi:MAG: rumA, partial [Rhizobium sp.]|nr:rumA [Rhizobium sp.]